MWEYGIMADAVSRYGQPSRYASGLLQRWTLTYANKLSLLAEILIVQCFLLPVKAGRHTLCYDGLSAFHANNTEAAERYSFTMASCLQILLRSILE